jgi:hypothetical protein
METAIMVRWWKLGPVSPWLAYELSFCATYVGRLFAALFGACRVLTFRFKTLTEQMGHTEAYIAVPRWKILHAVLAAGRKEKPGCKRVTALVNGKS